MKTQITDDTRYQSIDSEMRYLIGNAYGEYRTIAVFYMHENDIYSIARCDRSISKDEIEIIIDEYAENHGLTVSALTITH